MNQIIHWLLEAITSTLLDRIIQWLLIIFLALAIGALITGGWLYFTGQLPALLGCS